MGIFDFLKAKETLTKEYIEAINPGNETILSEALSSAGGQRIEKVYYGIVNYTEGGYEFEGYRVGGFKNP